MDFHCDFVRYSSEEFEVFFFFFSVNSCHISVLTSLVLSGH